MQHHNSVTVITTELMALLWASWRVEEAKLNPVIFMHRFGCCIKGLKFFTFSASCELVNKILILICSFTISQRKTSNCKKKKTEKENTNIALPISQVE